jgi:hypothetical protein
MNKLATFLWMFAAFLLGVFITQRAQSQLPDTDENSAAAIHLKAETAWRDRASTCENNFTGSTVLYEPGSPASLPLLHGLLSLQANLQGSAPRWVIPAKIQPRTMGAPGSLQYVWVDGKTQQTNGPFTAMPLQAGERFNVTGWISQ